MYLHVILNKTATAIFNKYAIIYFFNNMNA